MTDLEALKEKPHALTCESAHVQCAEARCNCGKDERDALVDELAEALSCGAPQPVSGCDCKRCLVHSTQRALLAQFDAESALANARAAAMEEAARFVQGVSRYSAAYSLHDSIRALAPLPASVRCVRVEVLERVRHEAWSFFEEHGCKNGCAPDDMTCDTNRFRAALAELEEKP